MDDWYDQPGRGSRGLAERGDVWNGMHDGMGWGGWLLMFILLLLLVALVVGVVLMLVRSPGGLRGSAGAAGTPGGPSMASSGTAQQVLDERYARGEIEEDEYLRRRSVLRGQ